MKKSNVQASIVCIVVAFLIVAGASFMFSCPTSDVACASAKGEIFDMLSDEIIVLFEQEIAKKPVVSNMNEKAIEALADKYQISVQKTKTILLLHNLCEKSGDCVTIGELATMRDGDILKLGKSVVDDYCKTLSDEQKQELKQKFLGALKTKK